MQPNFARDVFLSPEIVKGIRSLPFQGRDVNALKVLLHEYAHVAQNPDFQKRGRIEGGAERFARDRVNMVLQKLGLTAPEFPGRYSPYNRNPSLGYHDVYPGFTGGVSGMKGSKQFVDSGQFGNPPPQPFYGRPR